MTVLNYMDEELSLLGLADDKISNLREIRSKDGVHLYRMKYEDRYFVIKYFEKNVFRREIEYYKILKDLDIPTIEVIGHTDKSLLLEDLDYSPDYRLGIEEDLSDIEVATALASWYKELHNKSSRFLNSSNIKFYKEVDYITKENIEFLMDKTNTKKDQVWKLLLDNLDRIFFKINEFKEVFTYNDFYWTNLVVHKDKKEALMLDYNMLGVGFRYSDIRNVCSSLSHEAGRVFIKEYGNIDQGEKELDDVISILVTLILAFQREIFPTWAQESLDRINNGELYQAVSRIL